MALMDVVNEILNKENISGMTRLIYYKFVCDLWIELDKYEKARWESITKGLITFYSKAYGLSVDTLQEIAKLVHKQKGSTR